MPSSAAALGTPAARDELSLSAPALAQSRARLARRTLSPALWASIEPLASSHLQTDLQDPLTCGLQCVARPPLHTLGEVSDHGRCREDRQLSVRHAHDLSCSYFQRVESQRGHRLDSSRSTPDATYFASFSR